MSSGMSTVYERQLFLSISGFCCCYYSTKNSSACLTLSPTSSLTPDTHDFPMTKEGGVSVILSVLQEMNKLVSVWVHSVIDLSDMLNPPADFLHVSKNAV